MASCYLLDDVFYDFKMLMLVTGDGGDSGECEV